ADQLDREKPVLQIRAFDLDMIGKREAPLERAVGNTAVDIIVALLLRLFALAAGDDQHVLLSRDVDLVGREPGDRQLDAIIVIAELDEVERRVFFRRVGATAVLEHVEQPVEADSGAPIGRKIKSTTHVMSSKLSDWRSGGARAGVFAPSPDPIGVWHALIWNKASPFQACGKHLGARLARLEPGSYR